MSFLLSVTLTGVEKIIGNFKRAREVSGRAHAGAINKTALEVERQAKLKTPVGFSGSLRSSITTDQATPDKLKAAIGTNVHHAPYVERDTRPHFPPIAPLKLWAQRKLGNAGLAYAIAKKIGFQGTKGQKMFEQAAQYVDQQQIHRRNLEEATTEVSNTAKG